MYRKGSVNKSNKFTNWNSTRQVKHIQIILNRIKLGIFFYIVFPSLDSNAAVNVVVQNIKEDK